MKKTRQILCVLTFLLLSYLCWKERSAYHNLSTLAKDIRTYPFLVILDLLYAFSLYLAFRDSLPERTGRLLLLGLMLPSVPNFEGLGSLHLAGSYCGLAVSTFLMLRYLWQERQKFLYPYLALLMLLTALYCHDFAVTSLMEWIYLGASLLLVFPAGKKNCIS